jgi:positive regulator of sigma E activity
MIPCLIKTLFGIECLGCGLQRAIILILKGNLIEAFYMYPAVYMVLLFLGMVTFNTLFKHKNNTKILSITGILTGIFILSGYIYKNL